MLESGRRVGAYVIDARIGEGGMAEVYRVHHAVLGSVHALKVLRPELAAHADVRARFLAEARVQAQIRHPRIAVVTDLIAEEGVAGLVMEYLPGGNLEHRLAEHGPLPPERVVAILGAVLDALEILHLRGVVHRDLKPANLMFRDEGWEEVVLVDFGIARVAEEGARRTRTGMMLGTPAYMSPEQVKGQPVDARSDVFSAGVLAWELMVGRVPFDGDSEFGTMQAIVDGRRPRLAEVAPRLPPGVVQVVERALSARPEDRPGSAGALASLLRGGLRERAMRPEPPTLRRSEVAERPTVRTVAEAPTLPVPDDPQLPVASAAPPDGRPVVLPPDHAAPRRGCGCGSVLMTLLVLTLVGAMAVVGGLVWLGDRVQRSEQEAAAVIDGLRSYKTDPAVNGQDGALDALATRAAAAVAAWPTSDALGAAALVEAQQGGWHLVRAQWDAERFASLSRAVQRAEQERTTRASASAALIRAMAGCRLHPTEADRASWCQELPRALQEALALAPGRGLAWLRAELVWVAGIAERAEIARRREAGDRAGVERGVALALRHCEDGVEDAAAAPVNGRYLLQGCVVLAGQSFEIDAFLAWSDALVGFGRSGAGVDAEMLATIYRSAAPICAEKDGPLVTWREGRPVAWREARTGGWGDFCVWLGRQAEGCGDAAEAQRPTSCRIVSSWFGLVEETRCEPLQEPGVPWDAAEAAVERHRDAHGPGRCELR